MLAAHKFAAPAPLPPRMQPATLPAPAAAPDPLAGLAAAPVFVVGQARSGTTWVYDLLTAHPEVAGVFESWLFAADTGVRGLFHWAQWSDEWIERQTAAIGRPFGLNALGTRAEMLAEVRALAGRWFAKAIGPGQRYLVEKSPAHLFTMPLIAEVFPGARFVHVIRDGRDVAVSMRAAAAWNPGWGELSGTAAVRRAAAEWSHEVTKGREHAAALGDAYAEVRFEALHADTEAELARLFEHCRIAADAETVRAAVRANDFGAAHGGGGEGSFRRGGRVGDWRARLSLRERFVVERAAGALLRELGYAQPGSWWLRPGPA